MSVKLSKEEIGILQTAKSLIADGWTQGYLAKTALGMMTSPLSENCASVCTVGAVMRANGATDTWNVTHRHCYCALIEQIHLSGPCYSIPSWNDKPYRTQQEVLDLFKATIDSAKKELQS